VVFPNRRSGIFLAKALAKRLEKPVWMPTMVSFEDFVLELSGWEKMEKIEAIHALYLSYQEVSKHQEGFDQFYFWGEMILRDFEELDQYLAEPAQLFKTIKDLKEIDEQFYFIDEKHRALMEAFWSHFFPEANATQRAFLETWEVLFPVYQHFTQKLSEKKQGYIGLIYRDFQQRLKNGLIGNEDQSIWFAGFNVLTSAEEQIIKYFIQERQSTILWDLDAYYMEDDQQEAGFFLRQYAKDPILGPTFPQEPEARIKENRYLRMTGVSLEAGQAKALASDLAREEVPGEDTVIILPKEYMLMPVLHAIHPRIEALNITMGYPVKETDVYALVMFSASFRG
jgi:hypothetical protein